MNKKLEQAKDIALLLSDRDDTDVAEDDIQAWHEWDIYEWIEAWGHVWVKDKEEWVNDEDLPD